MQEIAPTTDALPALGLASVQTHVPFVLLPCQLDLVISDHADFLLGCSAGVDFYVYDSAVFSTPRDVYDFVMSEVCRSYSPFEVFYGVFSLPYRVGFTLGFLSALGRVNGDLACFGVDRLRTLVPLQYYEEVRYGHNPLVAVPGLCSA